MNIGDRMKRMLNEQNGPDEKASGINSIFGGLGKSSHNVAGLRSPFRPVV